MKYRYSSHKRYSTSSSMGFLGWLQLLLIGFKLTNLISWSWLWVLSPLWISFIIAIIGIIAILLLDI